jgi:radical SAM protein with 4Fe4S-binding SPASM domain
MEKEHPELCNFGDMPFGMVEKIAEHVPSGIVIQFFNNGEPLLYPRLADALKLFEKNIRCLNTNAKLLYERADDIIGNLETITISVIEKDPEAQEQFETVQKFIEKKGNKKPAMVYRLLGKVENPQRWEKLPGIVCKRILHAPEGSFKYEKEPTKPEIGICLDLLNHLAIDHYGNVSPCVRYDPHGWSRLGNILDNKNLSDLWNNGRRQAMIKDHIAQRRDKWGLCSTCEFWGVPKG